MSTLASVLRLPDLRRKITLTMGMSVLFRLAVHIPVPMENVDVPGWQAFIQGNEFLQLLDMFSGGALSAFSVVALGLYPYFISVVVRGLLPGIGDLQDGGERGRQKLEQYTWFLAVLVAFLLGYILGQVLHRQGLIEAFGLLGRSSFVPTLTMMFTLTAGTFFLLWLSDLITEEGIGDGRKVVLFAGFVALIPGYVSRSLVGYGLGRTVAALAIWVVVLWVYIFINEGERRIPVRFGKRVRSVKLYGSGTTSIPLKVNSGGLRPLIYVISVLGILNVSAGSFSDSGIGWIRALARLESLLLNPSGSWFWIMFFFLATVFCLTWVFLRFDAQQMAHTLQRQWGYIPLIKPGRPTDSYLRSITARLSLPVIPVVVLLTLVPFVAQTTAGIPVPLFSTIPVMFGAEVVVDAARQLEAQLALRHYNGFLK